MRLTWLGCKANSDAQLRVTGRVSTLRRFGLRRCAGATEAGLNYLRWLRDLDELSLTACERVGDSSKTALSSLALVARLSLVYFAVSTAGLALVALAAAGADRVHSSRAARGGDAAAACLRSHQAEGPRH